MITSEKAILRLKISKLMGK